jgi:HEAT repeat protein
MGREMEMTWKWIGRLFRDEPEPFWADPHLGTPSDRLMWLLDGLGSRRWGALAAERLRTETAALDPAEWARMDLVLRERLAGYSGTHAPSWARGPDDVRRMVLPPGTEAAVMGVLSTHPNGYVRQAAVERLALLGDGGELPPLLLRANDWVPQVRAPAHEALRARVVVAYVPHWVRSLALVLRLRRCGRGHDERLVEGVLALLRSPAARDEVRAGLSSPDTPVRRACLRILLDAEGAGLDALIGDALESGDAMLRLLAAQAAARLDEPALRALLPRMMQDRFARVRLVALRLGVSRPGVVLPALLDRSPAVRAEARAALARLEPLDFAAFYRGHVAADGPRLPAAVAGLAETGGREDADLLAPLLAHARPRVRAAALLALARLTGDDAVPALVRAMGDSSRAVSHAATVALRPRAARADVGAWFLAPHPAHVRRNALSLLARRGKWEALPWILHACADAEPEVRASGIGYLRRWQARFNRSFSQPTAGQRERIRAALEREGLELEPRDRQWLRFAAGIPADEPGHAR